MNESTFKRRLFWFLLGSKLIVLLYLFLVVETGVASYELRALSSVLIASFVGYIGPLWKDVVANKVAEDDPGSPTLRKRFVQVSYIAFPLYVIVTLVLLTLVLNGALMGGKGGDFIETAGSRVIRLSKTTALFAGLETVFALYLAPIIASVTEKKKVVAQVPVNPHFSIIAQHVASHEYVKALTAAQIDDPHMMLEAAQLDAIEDEGIRNKPKNISKACKIQEALWKSMG
ncbi:MAG: hypothetical protein AAFU33_21315 [Bacteroidota bacterium]